jgi:predicted metal-dependent hydrolase
LLSVRPGTGATRRQEVLDEWYRRQVRAAVVPLLEKWQPIMGVRVEKLFIQKMKTKWGGCSPERQYVRLNTDLAKKPVECLEYVLVHEMTHILERHHNQRFVEIMSRLLPNWHQLRQKLNESPLSHVEWEY